MTDRVTNRETSRATSRETSRVANRVTNQVTSRIANQAASRCDGDHERVQANYPAHREEERYRSIHVVRDMGDQATGRVTNRATSRDEEQRRQTPTPTPFEELNRYGSYSTPVGHSGGEEAPKRISQRRLEEIAPALCERDRDILSAVRHCRYLITKQIRRLYFTDAETPSAGLRAANRNLSKLKDLGLINSLSRRIGGVRSGSGSLIWYLTQSGERLLRLGDSGAHASKRFFEPSPHFLAHTLAVAECYVQLTEMCGGHGLKLAGIELETDCWRSYSHQGKLTALKPDLFAITDCGDYEDRWFFEIDLKSEAPVTIVEKCRRYHQYYRSGLEQKQHEVFPLVVWIVPDAARKESLVTHIRAEFDKLPRIFIVITPDELEKLIRQGVEGGKLC